MTFPIRKVVERSEVNTIRLQKGSPSTLLLGHPVQLPLPASFSFLFWHLQQSRLC